MKSVSLSLLFTTLCCALFAPSLPAVEPGFTNSLGMKFVPVPGTKVLFCIHDTRVKDFAAFVADNRAYDYSNGEDPSVLDADSSKQRSGYSWKNPGFTQTGDHPVTCVSWEDAKTFCAWVGKKEGRTYRLPTDHEWSIAVGIGDQEDETASPESKHGKIQGVYPWGSDFPPARVVGNFAGDEAKTVTWPSTEPTIKGYRDGYARTSPVMSFSPNKLGLYDLSGNVWQWCEDWYNSKQKDRVQRGGSWAIGTPLALLSSFHGNHPPSYRSDRIGFRVVLVAAVSQPPATATANPADSPAALNQSLLVILSKQTLNAEDWVVAPLDERVPADIRQNLISLREDMADEGKQKPKASEEAYSLGYQLCNTMVSALDERARTLVRAGYTAKQADANTGVTSPALEANRNYMMSWPQYKREQAQRGELLRQKLNGAKVIKEGSKVEWSTRATQIRSNIDLTYAKFRALMR